MVHADGGAAVGEGEAAMVQCRRMRRCDCRERALGQEPYRQRAFPPGPVARSFGGSCARSRGGPVLRAAGFDAGRVRDGTPCPLPVPGVGFPQDGAVGAILTGVVTMSAAGAAAVAGKASAIDGIVTFLPASAPLTFAAAAVSDLSWLTPIANLVDKLRRGGIKRQWCRNRRQGR